MSADDKRETAAAIFDRTSRLAATIAERMTGEAKTALSVASGIAKGAAAILRAVGVRDAGTLIEALAADKAAGVMTPADIRRDDDAIEAEIQSTYDDDAPAIEHAKTSKRKRKE